MNYAETLQLTWIGNSLADVDHPEVDDIRWDSYCVFNKDIESQDEFNEKVDDLMLLRMGIKDDSKAALRKAYSDCDPEEANTIVYVVRHKDDKVEIVTPENDKHGGEFIRITGLLESGELKNFYEVQIEDNLL
ncbi:MAG: hypothetical protein JXR12_06525 [Neptunomonas phycophila]|uniref:hypothetical protein n=1 Tax=Neptunomonas phycophila TaxID=1572645 RepID=UPI003B8E838F